MGRGAGDVELFPTLEMAYGGMTEALLLWYQPWFEGGGMQCSGAVEGVGVGEIKLMVLEYSRATVFSSGTEVTWCTAACSPWKGVVVQM